MVFRGSAMASSESSHESKISLRSEYGEDLEDRYGHSSREDHYGRNSRVERMSEKRRNDNEKHKDQRHRSSSRDRHDRHSKGYRHSDDRRRESSADSRSKGDVNRHRQKSRSSYYEDRSDSHRYSRDRKFSRSRDRYSSSLHSEGSKRSNESRSSDELSDSSSVHGDDYEVDTPQQVQPIVQNMFQNDGSFLEMFKKMQEAKSNPTQAVETEVVKTESTASTSVANKTASIVGKRRGGRVLPTGVVKKLKQEEGEEVKSNDAWSMYLAEVRKYRQATCDEDRTTRPLVK